MMILGSYYFFYLVDLNDFHRFPMVFKILLVFISRFWLTSLRGKNVISSQSLLVDLNGFEWFSVVFGKL